MSRFRELSVQKAEPDMPAVVEARSMLCAVPIDLSRGESKGVWLQRVGRLLGLSSAKAKRIYYQEVKRIDADTYNRMRTQLNELQERAEARRETLNEIHRRIADLDPAGAGEAVRRDGGGVSPAGGRVHGTGTGGDGAG